MMTRTLVPKRNKFMTRYSGIARFFHWSVAGLIVSQYVLAKLAESAKHHDRLLEQLALLANHKSIGITILALAVLRLAYRCVNKAPELPRDIPAWQKSASHASHTLLYGLLFAMPISGWLMSSAKAYSVSWFNLFALPDFVAPSEPLADTLHTVHHYLAEALFVIALLHILAAVKHHFIDKDNVLRRMAGLSSLVLFLGVSILAIALFGRFFESSDSVDLAESGSDNAVQVMSSSELPIWKIDYDNSYIRFSGDQAGAPFTGDWKVWSADIQFDAAQLEQARFNVTIDTSSAFSNDKERDETIASPEFFDVATFKEARYLAQRFEKAGDQFRSLGQLSMKGATSDTVLNFSVTEKDGKAVLTGTASLNRLLWNIGTGDWADTSWVGEQVKVDVMVTAFSQPSL